MSDLLNNIEIIGLPGGPAPAISAEGLAEYKRMLADPTFAREHPECYAALKTSVDAALTITGQQLEPPDPRTPAQIHFDTSRAMTINPVLRDVVLRENGESKGPPDPERTAEALEGVGMTHKQALEDAQRAVKATPALAGVKVENLPVVTLATLARFGEHIRKQAANRPQ